ncbi:MAG: helix-turn-helix domain-containing protein [Propionibacteriaceae bacterium]|jgi:transcriptional regulator with XRE-family HTH domain|nr:helix-turn-helix domain-containing protein [Propionibacteriaceae bacterium]
MTQPWYRARTLLTLGTALADIRRTTGLSQSDAAEQTRTSRPTISRLERGHPVSTATVVDLLAATRYEILLVPRGSRVTIEDPS